MYDRNWGLARGEGGYGVKIFLPSPPNNVTRSPGLCLYRTMNGKCRFADPIVFKREADSVFA